MSGAVRISLPVRIAAADVPALHASMLEAIEAGSDVVLDARAVERVDSAAAQWLIVCERSPSNTRPTIEASEALQRTLGMAGLSLAGDDPA